MDHAFSIDHPWRTRALAAAAIALIELVLLLGIGLAVVGHTLAAGVEEAARDHVITKDRPVAAQPKRSNPASPRLTRSETSILVLNGNGQTGAAAAAAERVRALKYTVGGVGNAPRSDGGRSVVMFRPGYEGEARRLARDLRIKAVGPLDGLRLRDLMGAHVALILGT